MALASWRGLYIAGVVGLRVHVSNSSRRKTTYCWWRCLRKAAMRQKQTGAPLSWVPRVMMAAKCLRYLL